MLRKIIGISLLFFGGYGAWGQNQNQAPATGGYRGPSVLSRAGAPLGKYVGQPILFRFYAGASGSYFANLSQPVTDQAGNLVTRDNYGVQGRLGVYGARHGKNSTVALDYQGVYRAHFGAENRRYDGIDQRVGVNYANQVSYRTAFEVAANAATSSFNYSGLNQPVLPDPNQPAGGDITEGFDNRLHRLSGRAGFARALTQRWILAFSGGGFYAARRSDALIDSRYLTATGSAQYSVSESASLGPAYEFGDLDFSGGFGVTRAHGIFLALEKDFSSQWTLSARAGANWVDTERVETVALDPIIAAIVGRAATLQPLEDQRWIPAARVTLGRGFQQGNVSVHYWRGIQQGASFLAASEVDSVGLSFSYTATERLNVGGNTNYYRAEAFTQGDARYGVYGAGAGMSYRLTGPLFATARASYYRQKLENSAFDLDRVELSVGLMFSPGERPLSLF